MSEISLYIATTKATWPDKGNSAAVLVVEVHETTARETAKTYILVDPVSAAWDYTGTKRKDAADAIGIRRTRDAALLALRAKVEREEAEAHRALAAARERTDAVRRAMGEAA